MANSAGTIEFLAEALAPLGHITVRRMFGGAGIYCDGLIFGLLDDDVLYLKADAESIPLFQAEGMAAFSYDTTTGTKAIMSYWRMPERLFDDPDELLQWGRRAVASGQAAAVAKTSRRQAPKPRQRPSNPKR